MLVGGPALYLVGENLFRLRMIGTVGTKRVVAVFALGAAGILAGGLPALAVGAIVAALLSALALWESASSLTMPGRRRASLAGEAPVELRQE